MALICQFYLRKTPLPSLDIGSKDKGSFRMAFSLSDQLTEELDADKANDEHITEQVIGEEIDYLIKMVSNCKLNLYLNNLNMVLTFLGN